MEHTILIVEDEMGIRDTVSVFLKNQGYKVYTATNGQEGLEVVSKHEIHLAIVDIMMPVMDGITMTMKLRQKYDFPIIFLSAKSEDIDKITGLNIGGDDYVTKPFEPMELVARVNTNIRRYEQIIKLKNMTTNDNAQHKLVVGGLELDKYTLLMSYPGRVYSAEEIYQAVWKEEAINTETIMVHIRKLREKIEINPKKPEYLKVVWGIGYKIEKV